MKKNITLFAIFLLFNAAMECPQPRDHSPYITYKEREIALKAHKERQALKFRQGLEKYNQEGEDACLGLTAFCGGVGVIALLPILCIKCCASTSKWLEQRNTAPSHNIAQPKELEKMN